VVAPRVPVPVLPVVVHDDAGGRCVLHDVRRVDVVESNSATERQDRRRERRYRSTTVGHRTGRTILSVLVSPVWAFWAGRGARFSST
jgi:hypothetical protein